MTEQKKEEKFRVNEYYAFKDLGRREIFKVLDISDERMFVKSYRVHIDLFTEFSSYTSGNSIAVTDSQIATNEDVKHFERAEHFHSKHREYNEFRKGDIVENIKTRKLGYVELVDEDGDVVVNYTEKKLSPKGLKCTGALFLNLMKTAEDRAEMAAEGLAKIANSVGVTSDVAAHNIAKNVKKLGGIANGKEKI